MITGTEFKKKRLELGYATRKAIAEEIGVSYEAVKTWENESRPVPVYAERSLNRIGRRKTKAVVSNRITATT